MANGATYLLGISKEAGLFDFTRTDASMTRAPLRILAEPATEGEGRQTEPQIFSTLTQRKDYSKERPHTGSL
jgi:hypothetical protein